MTISDYETLSSVFEDEFSLKGSRFIGIAMPCSDESKIPSCIGEAEKRYPDATHYCYAAIFNGSSRIEKSSDNGEPSGTAGKPILSVLKGSGLSDVICIVVRYFGGTLLGTGGLVHAYIEAAKMALDKVEKTMNVACSVFCFSLRYDQHNIFENKCKGLMFCKPDCEYSDKVDVTAYVRVCDSEEFVRRMTDLMERQVVITKKDDVYINGNKSV